MLYAITSYFNPCRYRKRLENYRLFREQLSVPLITAELGFDGQYDLGPDDAEIYVRQGRGDVLFQKERLLNLAARHLPADCTAVAWLDCDILFAAPSWGDRVLEQLESCELLQPFSRLYALEQSSPVDFGFAHSRLRQHPSVPTYLATDVAYQISGSVDTSFWIAPPGVRTRFRHGVAWVARRELFDRVGLYDGCILGSGDLAFCCALYGFPQAAVDLYHMTPEFEEHYLAWSARWQQEFPVRVSSIEMEVLQLWHGHYQRRRYRERHAEFARFEFQPHRDLRDVSGECWEWRDRDSPMAAWIRRYFHSRQEDGVPAAEGTEVVHRAELR